LDYVDDFWGKELPCDIEILAPRPRSRWWGESHGARIEAEAITWLARALTGVRYDSYDSGCGTDSFEFSDNEWEPTLRVWYMAPRVVEWKPELKRPSYLLALEIVVARIRDSEPAETLAEVTIFAGVRRTRHKLVGWIESTLKYETVWIYNGGHTIEGQKKYFLDELPRSIWGPLDLGDPTMRKYLPHRWLLKRP